MPRARDFACALVCAETLAEKLATPGELELEDPEPPLHLGAPGRPPQLQIVSSRALTVPPLAGMRDPHQRARILHAMANHELQAVELFAWALLAFPQAPLGFRAGLVKILSDEQVHLQLYIDRLHAHGHAFGDFGVTGHFWSKLEFMKTPLGFCCAMGMTFENANLDFAVEYAEAARAVGDPETAQVLERVHHDEINHVRFAWTWLEKLCGERGPWATYNELATFPLGPQRARGKTFDREARRRAGISDEFIALLEQTAPTRPSGRPR
jgi:uncharacterized ferritin-like protein (DUF455 family)